MMMVIRWVLDTPPEPEAEQDHRDLESIKESVQIKGEGGDLGLQPPGSSLGVTPLATRHGAHSQWGGSHAAGRRSGPHRRLCVARLLPPASSSFRRSSPPPSSFFRASRAVWAGPRCSPVIRGGKRACQSVCETPRLGETERGDRTDSEGDHRAFSPSLQIRVWLVVGFSRLQVDEILAGGGST
ncbi:hypothetical protein CRUP_037168 [Coryphaenoides rupestris]|nr:hypothetical protein CRUP_037168 [Coryphaenoides rupestris]